MLNIGYICGMKKKTIWLIAGVMGFSFLALLFLQLTYMDAMIKMKKEQLDESVNKALYQAARNLELNETLKYLEKEVNETERRAYKSDSLGTRSGHPDGTVQHSHQYAVADKNGNVYSSFELKTITMRPASMPKAMILRSDKNSISEATKSMREIIKNRYVYQKALLDEVVYNLKQNRSSRPEYNGLQLINIKVITRYLKQLLNSDLSLAPFTLVSLEQPVKEDIKVRMGNSGEYFLSTLGGFVDRIDIVEDNGCKTMRVVDYKTGGSRVDSSKFKTVDDIFTGLSVANHADYYLQAIAYSNIVRHSATLNPSGLPVAPALQFVQHNQTSSPVLCLDKHPITDVKTVEQDFRKNLDMLLTAMFDPEQPFQPVSDKKNCASCPYYNMCY